MLVALPSRDSGGFFSSQMEGGKKRREGGRGDGGQTWARKDRGTGRREGGRERDGGGGEVL